MLMIMDAAPIQSLEFSTPREVWGNGILGSCPLRSSPPIFHGDTITALSGSAGVVCCWESLLAECRHRLRDEYRDKGQQHNRQ